MSDQTFAEHFFAVWRDTDKHVVGFIPLHKDETELSAPVGPANDAEAVSLAKLATVELVATQPMLVATIAALECEIRATPFPELADTIEESLQNMEGSVAFFSSEEGENFTVMLESTRYVATVVDMPGIYYTSPDKSVGELDVVQELLGMDVDDGERLAITQFLEIQKRAEERYYSLLTGFGYDRFREGADKVNLMVHAMAARLSTFGTPEQFMSGEAKDMSLGYQAEMHDFVLSIPILRYTVLREAFRGGRMEPLLVQDGLRTSDIDDVIAGFDQMLQEGE
jgi:hypothetical protein